MVAPHDTGDLVRSLVRVPGSGSDRSAGSVCCDLARASTLAASVPVSTTLPPALMGSRTPKTTEPNTQENQTSVKNKLGGSVGVQSGVLKSSENVSAATSTAPSQEGAASRKRPRTEEPGNTESSSSTSSGSSGQVPSRADIEDLLANKRARIICMTPQQVAAHASNIVSIPSTQGAGSMLVLQLSQQSLNTAPLIMAPTSVAQLLQERNSLRQENQALQRQLSLFQQLFRNKERLTSVVKRLGVKVV
ncbi:putative protein TPRXL isoform X2 [Homarus americanus]|uniref:Uncharacterized protein n=1 Tax=Homarus americanus TaxID=6706 RepID=A0A8J5K7G0_HOMAM|nr:putative protein TPRXL isoform X2 [Homarus americanus]KAG7167953.1 hypothetical protein Hamer_G018380 [Homarus americanus]